MTFLASNAFLIWLLAASLPVVLYWLYRRRKSVVQWSANYILRRTLREAGNRNLWRQIVILSLRTLAIAALVVALAQPFLPRAAPPGELPHGDGSLHQIVLADNSRSMSIRYHSVTREAEMRSRLEGLLARMRHGDHCDLVPLAVAAGDDQQSISVPCPATPEQIAEIIDRLQLLERPARLLDGLQRAAEQFHVTASNNRHLVLLGDLSRKDLPDSQDLLNLKPELKRLAVRTACYEIRDEDRPNLAILDMTAGSTTMYAGWQYHVYLTLRNYGLQACESTLHIQIRAGDKTISQQSLPLDMKPMEQKIYDYPLTMPSVAGLVKIEASVDDESYRYDNIRSFSAYCKPAAKVLLVHSPQEDEIPQALWRESYYMQTALAAIARPAATETGPQKSGASRVRDPKTGELVWVKAGDGAPAADRAVRPELQLALERVSSADLTPQQVSSADAVVMCGVGQISPEVRAALERFVERGGGLLLGMGEGVYEDEFNDSFASLSPARLTRRFNPTQRNRTDWEYDAPHRLIEKTFTHPLLRHYLNETEGSIENVRIYNYFRLENPPAGLMMLDNGDPLLVERRIGRGAVLMLTSSLGGSWNTFPVRNMYSNFVYAWLTYLCSLKDLNRNLEIGDPLILEAEQPGLLIAAPDAKEAAQPLREKVVDNHKFYRYDNLNSAGEYRLVSATSESGSVAVREQLVESDTLGLSPSERSGFEEHLGCHVVSRWDAMADLLTAEEHRGVELLGFLVLAIMVLMFLDSSLTRIWFR